MAVKGAATWDSPFRAFGPVVNANQGTATYGPLASPPTPEMDGFMVTTAATAATLTDQNGQAVAFASIPVGVYLFSPSAFTTVGGGVFVPLYR